MISGAHVKKKFVEDRIDMPVNMGSAAWRVHNNAARNSGGAGRLTRIGQVRDNVRTITVFVSNTVVHFMHKRYVSEDLNGEAIKDMWKTFDLGQWEGRADVS